MAVRILGIDPGTITVGVACVEIEERSPSTAVVGAARPLAMRASNVVRAGRPSSSGTRVLAAEAIRLGRRDPVGLRLARLVDALRDYLVRLDPHELALEEAFHGKSAQSALRIGEARGVILATAYAHGIEVHQYPPARIKRAVAGHGGASKEAVAEMACRSLGIRSLAGPADVADALAVALCRVEERQAPTIG